MTFKPFQSLAAFAALALVLAFSSGSAHAQTVQSSITTSSAITATDGVDMAFGTWFLLHGPGGAGDDFSLTIDTAGVITDDIVAQASVATELVAGPAAAGTVLVTVPLGADGVVLQMTRGAITDFPSAALTMQNVTYSTASQVEAPFNLVAVPVTVITGGTDETVSFGADILVTATPADGLNTASFVVSFAY